MTIKPFGWAAIVAVVGSVACATNRTSNEVGLAAAEAAPTVTVQNDNWLDVAVYVVHGTSRFRIGTVSSTSSRTFRLPREGGSGTPLQIMADPIGENRLYITDPVTLAPGQRLEVKVASPISISSFAIWNR